MKNILAACILIATIIVVVAGAAYARSCYDRCFDECKGYGSECLKACLAGCGK